jgi:murein DD-endopeptidase MepM/ murein hydrolase activator NlpD
MRADGAQRRSIRGLAARMLLFFGAGAGVAQACTLDLPASVPQGGLAVGKTQPGCAVTLGERRVRVADDGTFVFGVGRDATGPLVVAVRRGQGPSRRYELAVDARSFAVERVDGVPPSTVTPEPALAARIAREQARVAAARTRDDDRQDFRFGFAWPLQGRVSGVYGSQRVLNGVPKDPHYGLDLAAPTGTPIRAPAAGVVTFADPGLYLTGGTLVLDHGHGLSSTFIHMSRLDKRVGDRVEQGDVLGAVGMTGRATGPHLHWGMNWFEVRIDPQLLLPPH